MVDAAEELRTPPHDTITEQYLIGCIFTDPRLIGDMKVSPSDFYQPSHELIWQAIRDLASEGVAPDFAAVHNRLLATGELSRAGGFSYLHDLQSKSPVAANADYYDHIVADLSMRRAFIVKLQQSLNEHYTSSEDFESLVMHTEDRLSKSYAPHEVGSLMNFDEFLATPSKANDWIVSDLLLRGDRLVLTGTEGLGKSMLLRQLAVCTAAGMHPFTGKASTPRTVLYIDAENPLLTMQKTLTKLRQACTAHGHPVDPHRLWIRRRPEGLNLGDPAERLWLRREAETVGADLVCIGPAYKLYFGGAKEREEDLARQVTVALDHMRETVGCAVILEHHAPHQEQGTKVRNVRPIGSSLWLRWPEFGFGIRLANTDDAYEQRLVDVVPWRGSRDERDFPRQLIASANRMPWVVP